MITQPTILLTLLGLLTVTSYRSLPSQTDSSPYITSTGEHVHKYGVAVSEDMLCPLSHGVNRIHNRNTCKFKDHLHYGDWIYIDGYGLRVVNDVMNPRMRKHIDLWVSSYKEEKAVGTRKLTIWLVQL